METLELKCPDADIIKRLRKIEGQVKGIQNMVNDGKYCGDILIQISAARAALNKVGGIILEAHLKDCISKNINTENYDEVLEQLVDTMVKYTK